MRNPFKKNHLTKEQRAEQKRREQLIRDFAAMLIPLCPNAQDLYTRVDVVIKQIDERGARRLEDYKKGMGQEKFGDWHLVAQDGKGQDIEQKIIDFFMDETVVVAETLMDSWKQIHDAFVRKELLERPADSLKIEFK